MEYKEYDAKYFEAKANKMAMLMWLLLGGILSAAYAVEVVRGLKSESVNYSENTTVTMMSKYEETALNITKIENTVGHLVEELGKAVL